MIKIIKSSVAKQDLVNIWQYSYEKYGEKQADKYIDLLELKISALKKSPMLGTDCSYIRKRYRKLKVEHHIVFYYINEDEVILIRILHKKMCYKNNIK